MIRSRVKDIQFSIRKIEEKAAEQDDCVRLDIGEPSFSTPSHIKEAAREAVSRDQPYTATIGIDSLREEVAREESMKKGVDVDPENIMVAAGGTEALYACFSSVLEKDEKAVLNDPCWGPYKLISKMHGNHWEQVKYFEDGEITTEARKAFEEAELAVLNTPSNPSGRVLSRDQARKIAELSEETGTTLVSDEVYHRLTFDREHVSPAEFTNAIIIGSASKNHAMTGWRIGWIAASEQQVQEFVKASRAMVACPPSISQYAAVEALRNDSHVEEMRKSYRERRDLVVERIRELGWSLETPRGGIYAFPDTGRDSWDLCLEMVEKGVAMVPGEPFGPGCDKNVRICFGSATKQEINRGFDILESEI